MLEKVIVNKSRRLYVEHIYIVVTGRCASRRSVSQTCVYQAYYFPLLSRRDITVQENFTEGRIGLPCVSNAVSIVEFGISIENYPERRKLDVLMSCLKFKKNPNKNVSDV